MNIIKIGKEYVNLDNAISIIPHGQEVLIVTEQRNYRISAYSSDVMELKDLLEKMSDKTKKDWED
jgi:hypothetical protein